jgi:superoxide dismutase, Cu-Zn family
MPASRRSVIVVAALGAALTVATGASVPASATAPAGSTARYSVSTGTFDVPATATSAFTYDVTQVPVGARIVVQAVKIAHHKTLIRLRVRGLLPGETYGAHVHYLACGATGAAAGAHYQNTPDPATGGSETVSSTNPAYANPTNEVWLDFVTDAKGKGRAYTVVDWRLRPPAAGTTRSVILHIDPTSTGGTVPPGNAGARLGCLNARV